MTSAASPPRSKPAASEPRYRYVYVWHWPVRAMHWLAAGSILLLIVTGFYIGRPYFMTSGEASSHFLMGWMRFLHFAAAAVLVATAIVRVYWLFVGNRYERWSALFPVRPRDWVLLSRTVKKYLFVRQERPPHFIGHNPLQQLAYTAIYGVAAVQVVTGFALFGLADPQSIFYQTFGVGAGYVGGIRVVRFVHHVLTWAFLIFIPIHVYLSLRADVEGREGTVSSIVSGGRHVRDDLQYEDA